MSQVVIARVFKQKILHGGDKGVDQEELCLMWLQIHFKKSSWLFLPGRIRGLSALVTQNDMAKFAKHLPWWAERKEDKPLVTCSCLQSCVGLTGGAVSFPRAGKLPFPACPGSLPRSRLFLPSTSKSSAFLQPQAVLSAGDKGLFRLSVLCNMQCCPWNCHFTLISYTSAWIYH